MSGEIQAVSFKPENDSSSISIKEREVSQKSGASSFDRLVEVTMHLNQSVSKLVKVSYVTLAFLSGVVGYLWLRH